MLACDGCLGMKRVVIESMTVFMHRLALIMPCRTKSPVHFIQSFNGLSGIFLMIESAV
jgi:hypothetical protein